MSEFENNDQNQEGNNTGSNMNYYQNTNNQSTNGQNGNNQSGNNQNASGQNSYNQNMYQQNTGNSAPEYSFWAEQAPGNAYTNYNQGANSWNQGYNQGNSQGNNQGYGNQNMNYQSYPSQNGNDFNSNNNKKKKERKPHRFLGFIGKSLSFGLIAGLVFFGVQQVAYMINPETAGLIEIGKSASKEPVYEVGYTSGGTIEKTEKSAISDVVDQTMPSIVSINCTSTQTQDWFGQEYSQEVEGSGSGFIVGKNEKELLIATNNHVVEGATKISVTFTDGSTAEAVIKGTDASADLAVISIDITTMEQKTLDAISIAQLGNSDDIKVGEMVIAIGNALGYGQSVTVGYISAKDREVEVSTDGYSSKTMVLLQTDAAINPGNSGGALINVNGEVIGINSVKYASDEVEGMGYAIPISKATSIINELMTREILAKEDQGYLGIMGNDVTEDVASYYNMPIGVFINEVSADGAADKAGLMSGDIITKIDKIEITSISQLREYVTSKRVGTEVTVTYMRKSASEYKEAKTTVSLQKNPNLEDSQQ